MSFSKVKLIKSYLISITCQQRLNALTLLSIEKNMLNEINYDNLIDNFTSQKVQKINLNKNIIILINYFINLKKPFFLLETS